MAHNLTLNLRAESLIEALPYIQRFRGDTFVVKYGGSSMEDESQVECLLRDVVFLEAVGINPVLVHGGGKAITAAMRRTGLTSHFIMGLRVTDKNSISIVEKILDTKINPRIVSIIKHFGGKAIGFSGKAIFQAKHLPLLAVPSGPRDTGFVGEVHKVQTEEVQLAIKREVVPVISPLGSSVEGYALNINADTAASALATALKASKLIFVSDVPGIMLNPSLPKTLVPSITCRMVEKLIKDGTISQGMVPKVQSATRALQEGVAKVHLVSGGRSHCLLLEIFSDAGIGTEILP
ncbi:Acetylglutamate kinase [Candidatus Xiphinematobacter sp. Idaho Grape]|uniref:acetylglutamate kinase n=1 Tax=Candidatus Xiphinematobacter sp. Idaho Grape TaxID=1704307 RepID=UPI0007059FE0|nr:acetylglutamate kinase [Candidatus Xiphinematobacter sp. Idaho Grape]ALJ56624.1 Acetylglutamate kinase [Candidatus Xiphinematobacter sp. Idaho Grape]